jgi:hypothetical protein
MRIGGHKEGVFGEDRRGERVSFLLSLFRTSALPWMR